MIEPLVEKFFSYDMIKIGWVCFEGMLALTHFMVLFGIRNSDLDHLRRKQIYFLEDGLTHLLSIFYYSINQVGIVAYLNWRVMLIVHILVWLNLILNPPHTDKSRLHKVYHWSCSDCVDDRFDFSKYGVQIIGTTLDVMAHSYGFYFMFLQLQMEMRFMALGLLAATAIYFFLLEKDFKTHKHMMPAPLKKLF